jgi:hypothetical protein
MHIRAPAPGFTALTVSLLASIASSGASAQSSPLVADSSRAEATVVRVDGEDLVVDVEEPVAGTAYRLFRPLTVRHPITGRTLRDRFPIGRVRLIAAGAVLSIVRADVSLERDPQVGDILVPDRGDPYAASPGEVAAAAPRRPEPPLAADGSGRAPDAAPSPPQPEAPPIVSPGPARRTAGSGAPISLPGTTAPERSLLAVWMSTLGQPVEARIQQYRDYLLANPASPFTAQVRLEILTLGSMGGPGAASPSLPPQPHSASASLRGQPASRLRPSDPAVVAFQLPPGSVFSTGVLHVRHQGQSTYRQAILRAAKGGFLRARLSERFVRPPGFAYFVELVDEAGRAVPAVGTAGAPVVVRVDEPARPEASERGRSRVDVRTEYADVGSGTFHGVHRPEWFLLLEGDFLQRVRWATLYGYRVGFGLYSGTGQPLSSYEDADAPPPKSGTVVYGYHELELELTSFVHAMFRAEVGMHEQGLVAGGQARLRIGDEQRTNIVIGGDVMDEVGQKAFFAFTFFPTERLPVLAEGEVFNQEIDGGDPMFRLVSQVGYRLGPWLELALRGSYQLRNIHHGGFGGGVAVTLDW